MLAFGENFPQSDGRASDLPQQAFAIATAGAGLVSFALVLALVEQVVLENVEENVKRGSPVVTSGHVRSCLVVEHMPWCMQANVAAHEAACTHLPTGQCLLLHCPALSDGPE